MILCRGSWCNDGVRWHEKTGVGNFGKLSRKTNEEKLRFGLISARWVRWRNRCDVDQTADYSDYDRSRMIEIIVCNILKDRTRGQGERRVTKVNKGLEEENRVERWKGIKGMKDIFTTEQWCMSRDRSLASRQKKCCLGMASTFWCLASVSTLCDIIIQNFYRFILCIYVLRS